MSARYIAMDVEGTVEVHARGNQNTPGNYATLCGLADDGEDRQHEVALPVKARINCDACRAIWLAAHSFDSLDFVWRKGEGA